MGEFEKVRKHFNTKITPEMEKFVDDSVLLASRYIFTGRSGRRQYGYCTHCQKDFENKETLKHGSVTTCPECGSECRVRASGKGHKHLRDFAYFVYYDKSIHDDKSIVAKGYFVERDYSGNIRSVETGYQLHALYLFCPGEKGIMYQLNTWSKRWESHKSVYPLRRTTMAGMQNWVSIESISKAVKGTPFQYSTWEKYSDDDFVRFFSLAAQYPSVEYLTKIGFGEAIEAKLRGWPNYGSINWRGKSIQQVLRLPKQMIKPVIRSQGEINLQTLRMIQMAGKDGSKFTTDEVIKIVQEIGRFIDPNDLGKASKPFTIRKTLNYLRKQTEKDKRFYNSPASVLYMLADYQRFCKELGMDLNDEYIHFPPHLRRQHNNLMKQVEIQRDALLDKKILKRYRALKRYIFLANDLMIRPAKNAQELIFEGEKLHHCVGTYVKSYADGETNILFVRRKSAPDVPFVTVEVRGGEIRQAYGHNDTLPTSMVKKFLDEFSMAKLKRKYEKRESLWA